MAARRTCSRCSRRDFYCLPLRSVGCCDPCARGYEPTPGTYFLTHHHAGQPPAGRLKTPP